MESIRWANKDYSKSTSNLFGGKYRTTALMYIHKLVIISLESFVFYIIVNQFVNKY